MKNCPCGSGRPMPSAANRSLPVRGLRDGRTADEGPLFRLCGRSDRLLFETNHPDHRKNYNHEGPGHGRKTLNGKDWKLCIGIRGESVIPAARSDSLPVTGKKACCANITNWPISKRRRDSGSLPKGHGPPETDGLPEDRSE